MNNHHVLWYKEPASIWEETLPIGNGRIGATIYGGIDKEHLCWNEDSLWSGYPKNKNRPSGYSYFLQARELVMDGKLREAQDILQKYCTCDWTEAYQPMGDIFIENKEMENVTDYTRSLDLRTGVLTVRMNTSKGEYERAIFASHTDNLIVMKWQSEYPMTSVIKMNSQHPYKIETKSSRQILKSQAPGTSLPSYFKDDNPIIYDGKGMFFNMMVEVADCDGYVFIRDNSLVIEGATSAILHMTSNTSFNGHDRCPVTEGKDHLALSEAYLQLVADKKYQDILADHIKEHSELYDRVKLVIHKEEDNALPTNTRIKEYSKDKKDIALEALLYHYGRYLLIACSREGTVAANLQGLWNDKLRAAWSCNYTTNINMEMNYWHAETANLPECHKPMLEYIKNVAKTGAQTAKDHYQCDGFTVHHNSDIWAASVPVGGLSSSSGIIGASFWFMGSAWLSRHMWEHYCFNLDPVFLKEEAYPILKEAVKFLLGYMFKGNDGLYYTAPSISPENCFIPDGEPDSNYQCLNSMPTMDHMIIEDVFLACLEAQTILDIDHEMGREMKKRLKELPPYEVGEYGELKEYHGEYDEYDIHHRHISHLYGLYPAQLIASEGAMADACRQTLSRRGDDGTGWSLAWKIACWARLKEGNHCHRLIQRQLQPVDGKEINYYHGGTYYNLFCAHPPFQIDGNFGYTAGVTEMLVHSKGNEIELLPALPDLWRKGSVKGLRVRGGATISFNWDNGELIDVTIDNPNNCSYTITCNGVEVKKIDK